MAVVWVSGSSFDSESRYSGTLKVWYEQIGKKQVLDAERIFDKINKSKDSEP